MDTQNSPLGDRGMKQLLLIRHAKSSWDDPSVNDFERSLNERGKKDAPVMAQRLSDKNIRIDSFISSPAKRASRTAKIFAEIFNKKKKKSFLRLHFMEQHQKCSMKSSANWKMNLTILPYSRTIRALPILPMI